jgi:hypothetical protein
VACTLMYQFDISMSYLEIEVRLVELNPRGVSDGQTIQRFGIRRSRPPARQPHAWIRTSQATKCSLGQLPRHFLRIAVPTSSNYWPRISSARLGPLTRGRQHSVIAERRSSTS